MTPSDRFECGWVRERLDDFVDADGLSRDEHARVADHVASCRECARELALARRLCAELATWAEPAAPPEVVARAEAEVSAPTIAPWPRARLVRWAPALAAAALLIAALAVEHERERAQTIAVEQAAREAAVAFAYVDKYARRAGDIVESEVLEQRLLVPVERAMEKSGVAETKPGPGRS